MSEFTPLQCIFSIPPISLGEVNLSGSLNVNNVSIPNTTVSHVQYLDIEDDLQALYAITLFSKYIISNSTFHWWGSYLSIYKDPVIIAPSKWASFKTSICRDAFLILK